LDTRAQWTLAIPMALVTAVVASAFVIPVFIFAPDGSIAMSHVPVSVDSITGSQPAHVGPPSPLFLIVTFVCAIAAVSLGVATVRMLHRWFGGARPAALFIVAAGICLTWALFVGGALVNPGGVGQGSGSAPVDLIAYSIVLLPAVVASTVAHMLLARSDEESQGLPPNRAQV
jgi:hypothetical protein